MRIREAFNTYLDAFVGTIGGIFCVAFVCTWVFNIDRKMEPNDVQPEAGVLDAGVREAGDGGVEARWAQVHYIPAPETLYRIEASTPLLDTDFPRVTNIELAAKRLDGKVLSAGDSFSFNETVGERSPHYGFMPATSQFFGGTRKTVGGGICQVSTTLYQALMRGGFEVVALNHSQQVDYAEPGLDAAVVWNGKDLRFQAPVWMRLGAEVHWADAGTAQVEVSIETREPRRLWTSEWVSMDEPEYGRVDIESKYTKRARKVRDGEVGLTGYRRWELIGENCGAVLGTDMRRCLRQVHREYKPVDAVFVVPAD